MLDGMTVQQRNMASGKSRKRSTYTLPVESNRMTIGELLSFTTRPVNSKQSSMFTKQSEEEPHVYWAGDLDLLLRPCASVIGARTPSENGRRRAGKIARQLADAGVVVTSGLAKGIDRAAHEGALAGDGKTIAVIGTPLDRAYPAENGELQAEIARNHLLISQFASGQRTYPSDFPKRNKLMAALTDASIIVEASDSSGTLHQAAECVRLKRWLFIMQSVLEDTSLEWPHKFLHEKNVVVLSSVEDVLDRIT